MTHFNTLSKEGSDSTLCLRKGQVVESFATKENTRIRAAGGVSAKETLMPK